MQRLESLTSILKISTQIYWFRQGLDILDIFEHFRWTHCFYSFMATQKKEYIMEKSKVRWNEGMELKNTSTCSLVLNSFNMQISELVLTIISTPQTSPCCKQEFYEDKLFTNTWVTFVIVAPSQLCVTN